MSKIVPNKFNVPMAPLNNYKLSLEKLVFLYKLYKIDFLMKGVFFLVALLSIGASTRYTDGSTIVFPTLHYSEGIPNSFLSTFKSTGIFTCEKGGLYLISANVISNTSGAWFKIMKTGSELSRTYIADFSSGYQSSTGVVVATLNIHDTISVNAGIQMYVEGAETTFTLVKLK